MKIKKSIKKVKRRIYLSKLAKKSLQLHKAYRGSKKLKAGFDKFLEPKYKR